MEEINKGKGTIAKVIGSFIRLAVFVCIFGIMLYVFPTLAKAMDKTAGAICTLFGIEREISVFSDFYDISAIAINKVIYLAELAKDNIDGIYEEKERFLQYSLPAPQVRRVRAKALHRNLAIE